MGDLRLVVRGGRVIDPAQGIDREADVLVKDGRVEEVTQSPLDATPDGYTVVDAAGLVVTPGFVDLHCHLREPGFEYKETIESGTRAAARGGFTTVCAMPNTEPAPDNAAVIEHVVRRARETGVVRVLPIGAVTVGRAGKNLAEMADTADAGAIGFSDDGDPVADPNVMRQALAYAKGLGLPIINHSEEPSLCARGHVNEGPVATRLGLAGRPAEGEVVMVARDIDLAGLVNGRLHVPHVSTRGAVELVRRAKDRGIDVTAEVTPHHLTLTEEWVYGLHGEEPEAAGVQAYDTNTKVNPPLRSSEDVHALAEALADGTIDVVGTDHAPQAEKEKVCTYAEASSGISVFETAFGSVMGLVHTGVLELPVLIERLTAAPARILGMELGTLKQGYPADLVVLDPDREWVVDPEAFASKGRNTPLGGLTLKGRVFAVIYGGEVVFDERPADAAGESGVG